MKKALILFSLVVLFVSQGTAQKWLWGKQGVTGDFKSESGNNSVVTDTAGNVWVAGIFQTSLIIGPDTFLTPYGNACIAEYDRNSNLLWAKQLDIVGVNSQCYTASITIDNFGHIYMAGSFTGKLVIGPDTLSCSYGDIFLAQFDLNGNPIWGTQSIGGGEDYGQPLVTDKAGNIYVAGSIYQSNTSFGSYTLTSWYNSSFILVKYDPHGHVIWARQSQTNVVGTQDNFAQSVAIDASANVYVTGVFFSEISFGTHRINDTDAGDVVLVKYDSSGNAVWVTSGVTSQVGAVAIGNSVATDLSGNSYITGMYVGSIQFGSFSLTSAGENIFIVKYNPAGNVIWAKTATIVPNNINTYWEGTALVTDNSKYLYLTASGNSNSIKFTTETFSPNSIIVKFDSNGNDLCGSEIPGEGAGVAVDSTGEYIYVVGEIGSGPSIFGADTLQGAPNNNTPFVARWENCCGKIGIIGSNSICPGFSTSLSASGGFGTYAWSNGDSTSTIKVSPSQSQRYSLTVNEGICVSSDSILVTVKPLPTITFSGDSAVCKGDSGVIIASGGDSYVWNTGATSNSISVVQFVATTYSVQVTKAGCVKDTTIKVPVTPLPVGAIISKSTVCPDSAIVLTAMGGSSYLWSTNSTNSSITVFPSSTSTYWVAVTLHGCTDTVSKLILTRPLPSITACCNTVINEGQSVSLSSSGNGSYSWSPSTGLSCDTCPDPVATPAQTTTYTLTVISDSGCVVRDFITIDISCGEVFIPDAFAPSDPMMHNNILYVRGACIASMDFLVFDRWGNKIFESENQDKGWDGNYNGQAMNTGTYIWYLKATLRDGTSIERKGNVTLVR